MGAEVVRCRWKVLPLVHLGRLQRVWSAYERFEVLHTVCLRLHSAPVTLYKCKCLPKGQLPIDQ